ncbi:MAG TPA: GAF domain-containing protein [Thermoanaerobaculia bacterium]|jgi:GAF domain-containing protein|nr:GAF domain-containing protein [Thermoanaerobaculia bacterium]
MDHAALEHAVHAVHLPRGTRLDGEAKRGAYADLLQGLGGVLPACGGDPVALMASAACLVHEAVPYASWTGFYRVVAPRLLRVGPYQGPLGCLEIPFDRGVCGAAARERRTQLVDDVNAFPGHIACDAAARSEIVVPVLDRSGELVAVLDVDSREPAAFDAIDRTGLEQVARQLAEHW